MKITCSSALAFTASLVLATIGIAPVGRAQNSVLTTIYTFPSDNSSGINPRAPLIQALDGNFYGGTDSKGFGAGGTVFSISPSGLFTILGTTPSGYVDEPALDSALIQAADGSFYGTSREVSSIYRVTVGGGLTFQHYFGGNGIGSDGSEPFAPLIQAANGSFYGTTSMTGPNNKGTVFRLNLSGIFSVIHSFNGTDGATSLAGLIQAPDGSFYGTTSAGGTSNDGTIFRIDASGALTTLYNFGGADGNDPEAALVLASDGNFYGTTVQGGSHDAGTIFRLSPNGTLTTLYSFTGGTDGAAPYATLIQATDGNLYGTTRLLGGPGGNGVLFRITLAGALTPLYAFTGTGDGLNPNGVIQARDGSFWGTTRDGGYNGGRGTVFRFGPVPAGTLQFNSATYNVNENAGVATITVSRAAGSSDAVSVSYATVDGTASSTRDYSSINGTLAWANGDVSDKTFQVPITDRHLTTGNTVSVALTLSAPVGGAALGLVSQSSIVITQNEIISQPTVTLTSPPDNLTVLAGASLPLAANVNDPSGILSQVQFQIDGQQVGSAPASGPYTFAATAPSGAGPHQITAVVIDNQNRQNTSSHHFVVMLPDANTAAPAATIVTDLNNRALAAGSSVTVSALASAGTANDQLSRVDFYADGVLFGSFDAAGNPVTGAYPGGIGPVRHASETALAKSAAFNASLLLPALNKLVSVIAVAVNKSGQSQISAPVSIQVVANVADRPPQVSISGVTNGTRVKVGGNLTVPVNVSDPDAGSGSAATRPDERRRSAFDVSGTISKVEYFLNEIKLGTSTQPPFSFNFAPSAAGVYVLSAIATDGAGLAAVSEPITVEAVSMSAVSLQVVGGVTTPQAGAAAKVRFMRTGDASADLTVLYKASGSAQRGVDYHTLSGTLLIPAGQSSATLKIKTLAGAANGAAIKLRLKLDPAGTYDIAAGAGKVILTIVGN